MNVLNGRPGFLELIELSIDGSITEEQRKFLEDWITNDPTALRTYCRYMHSTVCLDVLISCITAEDLLDIQDSSREMCNSIVESMEVQHSQGAMNRRRRIQRLIGSVAAILLFVFMFRLVIWGRYHSVAKLNDSLNAQWSNQSGFTVPRKYWKAGTNKMLLLEGYAEFSFKNRARLVLEGPVELQIATENKVILTQGKIFTEVPPEAVGFTVETNNAEIVDLGTEFGVHVDSNGATRLMTFKGKTRLIVGRNNEEQDVQAGEARLIAGIDNEIRNIECEEGYFVRTIDSKYKVVWSGQQEVLLTDIVGGGSGFGSGRVDYGFDPETGMVSDGSIVELKAISNTYKPIVFNPFVDGIFVPDGNRQVVSSAGHVFQECPQTNGMCFNNIHYAIREVSFPGDQLNDRMPERCLLVHANSGVTFDLMAIRKALPGKDIVSFRGYYGIEHEATRPTASNADFWVLVDGQMRFSKFQVNNHNLHPVVIELSKDDRYLTLMTTDGADSNNRRYRGVRIESTDSDWCMFVNPVLILE